MWKCKWFSFESLNYFVVLSSPFCLIIMPIETSVYTNFPLKLLGSLACQYRCYFGLCKFVGLHFNWRKFIVSNVRRIIALIKWRCVILKVNSVILSYFLTKRYLRYIHNGFETIADIVSMSYRCRFWCCYHNNVDVLSISLSYRYPVDIVINMVSISFWNKSYRLFVWVCYSHT